MEEVYTHIVLVLDRSGSMEAIKSDAIGGYNEFIKSQQAVPGKATFSLAQFNHNYDLVQDFVDLKNAKVLDNKNYQPGGTTALLDAVGRTALAVGERLSALEQGARPGKVVFVILTDGMENASKDYTRDRIKEIIKEQQEIYKWQFVFLSSDIDSFHDAQKWGIPASNTLSMGATSESAKLAFASIGATLCSYRRGASANMGFSPADREKQEKEKKKAPR